MAKTDRHFKTVFSAVLGVLIAIALLLIGVSRMVDSGPKGARDTDDPLMQASAHERIRPFGLVAVAGEDNVALAIPIAAISPVSASGSGASAAAGPTDGKSVYESACVACHDSGLAGAPRIGDRAAWAPRIAQGVATLESHAIKGFQGGAGFMPAKGGRLDLSDDVVKAAVEHMVAQSR